MKDKDKNEKDVTKPEEKATDGGQKENSPESEEKITAAAPEQKPLEAEEPVDTVDDLKKQLDDMSDRYLRIMAEFDNFKKRVSRDYERLVESANEKLMIDLIDVRENFDRALRAGTNTGGTDFTNFFEGMKLIYGKLEDVLKKHGLEVFAEKGDEFDPQKHDAMMKTPSVEIPEDHIADVFEKGYQLKNRIIKHAKVIISGGKPVQSNESQQPPSA